MKKTMTTILAAVMLLTVLAGCGKKSDEGTQIDLKAFYEEQNTAYDFSNLTDITSDLQESYYPGLSGFTFTQLVAKMPMMSSVVSEYVFAECQTEEDAAKVAEILQKRIDDQANGGAWYPDSMEAWKNAKVITHDKYVAMIASSQNQTEIEAAYNKLFA